MGLFFHGGLRRTGARAEFRAGWNRREI